MMTFRLRFDCENDSFQDSGNDEIANVLRELAERILRGEATGLYQNVRDSNGNTIGTFRLSEEREAD